MNLTRGASRANGVAVYCDAAADPHERQAAVATMTGLPTTNRIDDRAYEFVLVFVSDRLELRSTSAVRQRGLAVDFVRGPLGLRAGVGDSRLLFRALGPRSKSLHVLDATAGLARDAYVMARHGYHVTAVERCPVLAALIEDALRRAGTAPVGAEVFRMRWRFVHADGRDLLRNMAPDLTPDVIYLDPMFPPRTKSALVKQDMRILRRLVGDDEDAAELLALARTVARRHVVVKRMRRAPPLSPEPTRSYVGKTTRYDVYATAGGAPAGLRAFGPGV